MSVNRCDDPGWMRIGRYDSDERRSLWIRRTKHKIELCSGREGDDDYVEIDSSNPAFLDLDKVFSRHIWSLSEWSNPPKIEDKTFYEGTNTSETDR